MVCLLVNFIILALLSISCNNPFSPALDFDAGSGSTASADMHMPEGIFQNLQTAYATKDTLLYGKLFSSDFLFTYRDYDVGYDITWGRPEEMRVTSSLFQNADRLSLILNNIILATIDTDSLAVQYVRAFNLVIIFNPADVVRIDGRVNMQMSRLSKSDEWKISRWKDESNF